MMWTLRMIRVQIMRVRKMRVQITSCSTEETVPLAGSTCSDHAHHFCASGTRTASLPSACRPTAGEMEAPQQTQLHLRPTGGAILVAEVVLEETPSPITRLLHNESSGERQQTEGPSCLRRR